MILPRVVDQDSCPLGSYICYACSYHSYVATLDWICSSLDLPTGLGAAKITLSIFPHKGSASWESIAKPCVRRVDHSRRSLRPRQLGELYMKRLSLTFLQAHVAHRSKATGNRPRERSELPVRGLNPNQRNKKIGFGSTANMLADKTTRV